MPITKWVKSVVKKIKEAYNCDHTVGIHYDYSDTELVTDSYLTTDKSKRYSMHWVGDITFFDYCPDCGEFLPHKEKYRDAVEMVQMPDSIDTNKGPHIGYYLSGADAGKEVRTKE